MRRSGLQRRRPLFELLRRVWTPRRDRPSRFDRCADAGVSTRRIVCHRVAGPSDSFN